MDKIRKYTLIVIIFIILIVPTFLGYYWEYFFIREFDVYVVLILIFGFIIFFIMGKLIEIYAYNDNRIEVLKKNDIINAFISKKNRIVIWVFFPIIMIIEELIFRFYIIAILINQVELEALVAVFISSLVFSLFHIHTWFSYRSLRILLVNLIFPFLLGLFNGYIFLTIGIIPCIIIHYIIVLNLYYNLYKRYFKNDT
ncbi:MAG: CPBP family intramembrane metalloprotease [Candidatus Lokiarchaeota archaeon]|nr:CPBP family intramembrane metalloprotease [Candidatus Lokiarchaeota archaeon]